MSSRLAGTTPCSAGRRAVTRHAASTSAFSVSRPLVSAVRCDALLLPRSLSLPRVPHTDFAIAVFTVTKAALNFMGPKNNTMLCAPGCEWHALGDGICNPQCDNARCFEDRQDCATGATGCKVRPLALRPSEDTLAA